MIPASKEILPNAKRSGPFTAIVLDMMFQMRLELLSYRYLVIVVQISICAWMVLHTNSFTHQQHK